MGLCQAESVREYLPSDSISSLRVNRPFVYKVMIYQEGLNQPLVVT